MQEKRGRQRFLFQQPVVLRFREENGWRQVHGVTENASEMGVLLVGESEVPQGTEVEVSITLTHEIQVFAPGKVVRVERRFGGKKIAVAVACSRPFSESLGVSEEAPNLSLKVQSQVAGNVSILRCQGRIVRGDDAGAFRDRVLHVLARTPKIVVDLKGVEHIDSTGVGILTGLLVSAKRRGGEIKLASPSQRAKDVLRCTRLDTVFKVYEGDAEAVAAFPQGISNGGAV